MLWKGILAGKGSGGEGRVPEGSVLGSGDGDQDVGVSRSEMEGGGMAVEKVGDIRGARLLRALWVMTGSSLDREQLEDRCNEVSGS